MFSAKQPSQCSAACRACFLSIVITHYCSQVAPTCVRMSLTPVRPMTRRERRFARKHHLFLLRNVRHVSAARQRLSRHVSITVQPPVSAPNHHSTRSSITVQQPVSAPDQHSTHSLITVQQPVSAPDHHSTHSLITVQQPVSAPDQHSSHSSADNGLRCHLFYITVV